MKKLPWIVLTLILLAAPPFVSAQGLAIGARAGTLGLGGEVAFGLSNVFVLRGGFGVFPFEFEGTFDDMVVSDPGGAVTGQEYTISFPTSMWSAGIDIYLGGGPIRLMGGIMGRADNLEITSEVTEPVEIGNTEYDVPGSLIGTLEQRGIAPYAGIGFGKHTAGGFGFFLDIGAALAGEADVRFDVTGPLGSVSGIQEDLRILENDVEEDAGGYLKVWPIVSIGIKIPLSMGY